METIKNTVSNVLGTVCFSWAFPAFHYSASCLDLHANALLFRINPTRPMLPPITLWGIRVIQAPTPPIAR